MAAKTPLQKWFGYYSPLMAGRFDFHTGESAARFDTFMQFIHLGRWWTRIRGGHNLRRRSDRTVPTLADPIIARSDAATATMQTPTRIGHANDTNWIYMITAVGAGGVENEDRRNIREVVINAAGTLVGSLPNKPTGIKVVPKSNGSFDIYWQYNPKLHGAAPTSFKVYSDSGTGTIDYVTPVATVTYDAEIQSYSANSGVLAGSTDTAVLFVVRAVVASGEEKNVDVKRSIGRTTAPYATVLVSLAAASSPSVPLPSRTK